MAAKPGLDHALAEIADRRAGPCHLAGEAAHDLAVCRRTHAHLEQPAEKHLVQVIGAVQVVVGHGIAVAGIGAPSHRDGVVRRHQAHGHGCGRGDRRARRGGPRRVGAGRVDRRERQALDDLHSIAPGPQAREADRIRERRQRRRGQGRALAHLQIAEVERQPGVFDGHHELPRPAQHHQVEGRPLTTLEAVLDDVRRHLVDRAIEPDHVGRGEASGGARLAHDGQRGGQVPRVGEKREAGDLLLCRLVGLHARGSHLRPPRVQTGVRMLKASRGFPSIPPPRVAPRTASVLRSRP